MSIAETMEKRAREFVDRYAAIREQMAPILEQARGGADFAALAREHSEDSATAANGGDTGLFHRGQMVPVIDLAQRLGLVRPGSPDDPAKTETEAPTETPAEARRAERAGLAGRVSGRPGHVR